MIIELLQQMEAGRRKQARFTQGVELQKPSCMEDSPTEDPGPMKVAEAVMLRVLGCVADLTFLRQDSVVEGPGKAPGLQKPEPWQEEELKEEEWKEEEWKEEEWKEEEWKEEEWKEEDWDEEGNWVGEPAVPVPESGEEDWYENDTLDEFRSDGGEPYEGRRKWRRNGLMKAKMQRLPALAASRCLSAAQKGLQKRLVMPFLSQAAGDECWPDVADTPGAAADLLLRP